MRKIEQLCVLGPLAGDYRLEYYAPYDQWRHQDLKSGGARRGQRLIMGGQTCARRRT